MLYDRHRRRLFGRGTGRAKSRCSTPLGPSDAGAASGLRVCFGTESSAGPSSHRRPACSCPRKPRLVPVERLCAGRADASTSTSAVWKPAAFSSTGCRKRTSRGCVLEILGSGLRPRRRAARRLRRTIGRRSPPGLAVAPSSGAETPGGRRAGGRTAVGRDQFVGHRGADEGVQAGRPHRDVFDRVRRPEF